MTPPFCLDLNRFLNAGCASPVNAPGSGVVNAWGNSFPLEEMPFGKQIVLDGIPFNLAQKSADADDHIECLGQWLSDPAADAAQVFDTVNILGFGELGDQPLEVIVEGPAGQTQLSQLCIPNWLQLSTAPFCPSVWRAEKLRYAGGYDLAHLRPCFTAVAARLTRPTPIVRLRLGASPLAHVLAITFSKR
jgi:hypothetical protein